VALEKVRAFNSVSLFVITAVFLTPVYCASHSGYFVACVIVSQSASVLFYAGEPAVDVMKAVVEGYTPTLARRFTFAERCRVTSRNRWSSICLHGHWAVLHRTSPARDQPLTRDLWTADSEL